MKLYAKVGRVLPKPNNNDLYVTYHSEELVLKFYLKLRDLLSKNRFLYRKIFFIRPKEQKEITKGYYYGVIRKNYIEYPADEYKYTFIISNPYGLNIQHFIDESAKHAERSLKCNN